MQINSTPLNALEPLPSPTTARATTASTAPTDSSVSNSAKTSVQAQAASIPSSYTANAGGKSYSASVEETGGVYVASVEVPPEASASGSSAEAAEASLAVRIDALV